MNQQMTPLAGNGIWYEVAEKPVVAPEPESVPANEEPVDEATEPSTLELVELLLKEPAHVDRLSHQPHLQRQLFPRFLLITEASYLLFALVLVLILNVAPAAAYPRLPRLAMPPASWHDGTALSLPLAYMIGIVLAACVCLPSFYFHGLLAGVKLNWLQITNLIGKGLAANSIMLLGLLPAYVAVVLGLIVFNAPLDTLQYVLFLGLLLPFVSGVWGMWSIYVGLKNLTSVLSEQWYCQRWCFLRRLVIAWTAIYTTVVPLMVYRLWEYFASLF